MAQIHATRALALVGTLFRPQGRNPVHGLDCVGLCLLVYNLPGAVARDDYRLRGDHRGEIENAILAKFRMLAPTRARPGDLMLMMPAPDQVHLGVLTAKGFVHADARRRRVVETPGAPSWHVAGTYRLKGTIR